MQPGGRLQPTGMAAQGLVSAGRAASLSVAQLVERQTVVEILLVSVGPWFDPSIENLQAGRVWPFFFFLNQYLKPTNHSIHPSPPPSNHASPSTWPLSAAAALTNTSMAVQCNAQRAVDVHHADHDTQAAGPPAGLGAAPASLAIEAAWSPSNLTISQYLSRKQITLSHLVP